MKEKKYSLEDEGFDLYIVKRNDGKEIRLANFWQILRYIKTGNKDRIELLFTNCTKDDVSNPLLQEHQIIWWKYGSEVFHEATRDDQRAESEYQEVLRVIDTIPDIDPQKGTVGTLIKSIGMGEFYKIVDGVTRRLN